MDIMNHQVQILQWQKHLWIMERHLSLVQQLGLHISLITLCVPFGMIYVKIMKTLEMQPLHSVKLMDTDGILVKNGESMGINTKHFRKQRIYFFFLISYHFIAPFSVIRVFGEVDYNVYFFKD